MTGSNRRHSRCKRDALPTELIARPGRDSRSVGRYPVKIDGRALFRLAAACAVRDAGASLASRSCWRRWLCSRAASVSWPRPRAAIRSSSTSHAGSANRSPARTLEYVKDRKVFGVRFSEHASRVQRGCGWCCWRGLNSRPLPYQGSALPLSYSSVPCISGAQYSARRSRAYGPAAPALSSRA